MKRLDIIIDLDNCVYPFVQAFWEWCKEAGVEDLPAEPFARTWDFHFDWGMPRERYTALFQQGMKEGNLFGRELLFDDALDALIELDRKGHRLHVITDRFENQVGAQTYAWLTWAQVPATSVRFSSEKRMAGADAGIDDKPENVDMMRLQGIKGFLLDRGRDDQYGHPWLIPDWKHFLYEMDQLAR